MISGQNQACIVTDSISIGWYISFIFQTYVGDILLAVNPCTDVNIYGQRVRYLLDNARMDFFLDIVLEYRKLYIYNLQTLRIVERGFFISYNLSVILFLWNIKTKMHDLHIYLSWNKTSDFVSGRDRFRFGWPSPLWMSSYTVQRVYIRNVAKTARHDKDTQHNVPKITLNQAYYQRYIFIYDPNFSLSMAAISELVEVWKMNVT